MRRWEGEKGGRLRQRAGRGLMGREMKRHDDKRRQRSSAEFELIVDQRAPSCTEV